VIRQLKVFAISMVFTTVAMGFAYALPTALRDTASQVPGAFELPEHEESLLAAPMQAQPRGRSHDKPVDTKAKREDREGSENHSAAKDENHGSVVRVAAHCSVTGRAHGELVRSVASDKDMTVADAEHACKAAMAKQEEQVASDQSNKPDMPGNSAQAPGQVKSSKPATPGHSAQAPGRAQHEKPATPASPGKPDNPGKSH
jgi:hypothetical protein